MSASNPLEVTAFDVKRVCVLDERGNLTPEAALVTQTLCLANTTAILMSHTLYVCIFSAVTHLTQLEKGWVIK